MIVMAILFQAFMISKCVHWHNKFRAGTAMLTKLRQQIGTRYPDDRLFFARVLHWLWERACFLGLVILPLLMILLYANNGQTSYLLFAMWLAMPIGELCGIINRCEILDLRILNSELELLRNCYVDTTATH